MYTYELVCVIDAGLGSKEIDALKDKIAKAIPELKQTDDMGLMPLAYPLRGQDQAYFVSYHMASNAEDLAELKTMLHLEKGLAKFVFYAMKEQDVFLSFADLQKSFAAITEEEDAAKMQVTPKKEEEAVENTEEEDVVSDEE